MKVHNVNISLIKVIACVAVIGLHTFMPHATFLYYLCGFAVPFFFMSSGYFLSTKNELSISYSIRKILSVLKIVLLWVFFRDISIYIIKVIIRDDNDIGYVFSLIIKDFVGAFFQRGNMWQFWYLGALIIIYMLLPLYRKLFIFFGAEKKLWYGIPIFMIKLWVSCIIVGCSFQILSIVTGKPIQENVVQTFRVWSWIQYFLLGGIIKYIMPNFVERVNNVKHTLILVSISFMAILYQYNMGKYIINSKYAEYFYDSIFIIIWVSVFFIWLLRLNMCDIVSKIISYISSLTLGIYIIHPTIITIVNKLLPIDETITGNIVSFTSVTIISLILVSIIDKNKFLSNSLLKL